MNLLLVSRRFGRRFGRRFAQANISHVAPGSADAAGVLAVTDPSCGVTRRPEPKPYPLAAPDGLEMHHV